MQNWRFDQVDALVAERGLVFDEAGRDQLARAIAAAMQRASLTLERMARGEEAESSSVMRPPSTAVSPTIAPPSRAPLTVEVVFDAYATERSLPPRTRYEWHRVLKHLAVSVGHDDARRLTIDELIAWKDTMVANGLSPKTLRGTYLAAVRAVLRWGKQNERLDANPADEVSIEVKRKAGQGIRGFSDEEASIMLRAAVRESDPVRRWIPLLCKFSGARLDEVCQLRTKDIVRIGDVRAMRFDAEAGPLKNESLERTIPSHSALIAAGFLEFVGAAQPGPPFPSLRPDKFGKRGGTGTKRLGRGSVVWE